MTSRPDILFLVLDTQRASRLSCYGYEAETSPNLDKLAADATLFRHAITPAQWTVPTHTSMFTGLYPSVHGTRQSYSVVPPNLSTLAERLRSAGYYTVALCNNPLVGVVNNGLRRGFTSFLNYAGLFTSRPNQAGTRKTLFGRYRNWFKRKLSGWVHAFQDSFARSDELLEFAFFSPLMVVIWQTALSFKGNTAKSLNDAARLFGQRKGVKPDQPIFCFINLMGTHMPFHPSRRHIEQFAPNFLEDREARRYLRRFNGDVLGWLTPIGGRMAEQHKEIISGMYDAEVATQDEQLGEFFDKLRASGALDNTLVVVVADHGEHLGEKHFIGHSVSLYNELTHVPLIIRDPSGQLPRGSSVDHVVSTRRLFHTVLDAAGLADEREEAYSLVHHDANDPDHQIVFSEAVTPQNVLNIMLKHVPDLAREHRCDQPRTAVWKDDYKLILTGDDLVELYNYKEDPQELHNLRDERPEVVRELAQEIEAFERRSRSEAVLNDGRVEQNDAQLAHRLRALGYLE